MVVPFLDVREQKGVVAHCEAVEERFREKLIQTMTADWTAGCGLRLARW
jgi:hypothetical protein